MREEVHNFLHLTEDEAYERYADSANADIFWRLAVALGTVAAGAALTFFALERLPQMSLLLAYVVLLTLLYLRSSSPFIQRYFRAVVILFLLLQVALMVLPIWPLPAPLRLGLALLLLPAVSLLFRFRRSEYAFLYIATWGAAVWIWLSELDGLWEAPRGLGGVLWPTLAMGAFFAGASNLSFYRRSQFLADWRRSSGRLRERERMREEIEDARQIQLSMLPRTTPRLSWLDLSAASMPASEVGGDYYDYFLQEDGSLGLVVGDVAGHGLASGLLLAAVRGCLYLLRRGLKDPVVVLRQLDDMVRHTTDRRMLVTLQCALLARGAATGEMTFQVASAGHPPVLLWRAKSRQVEELSIHALPLGTRLGGRFQEVRTTVASGDLLLFYTDGLIEMANAAGDAFGLDGLARLVCEVAGSGNARDVRNALLSELANFKGDARRADDVTLVVVRVL